MTMDTVAFYEARAGTPAFSNIAALADQHVNVSGDSITIPSQCSKILAAIVTTVTATAGNTTQVQISSPSLRGRTLLDLGCFGITETPGNNPPFDLYAECPVELAAGETMQLLTINSGTNTETVHGVVFLTDGVLAMPPLTGTGIETVRATGATTVSADAWTAVPLTFTQDLRSGTYALVGMKAASTTMIAARAIFSNQGPRPGCVGVPTLYSYVDPGNGIFRYGRLGLWGTFTHMNPPQIEVLCGSADTAQEFLLDLVKVA